jgi:hypothetical protein
VKLSDTTFKCLPHFRLVFCLTVLSILIRFEVFKRYYVFSNDDLNYFDWVSVLSGNGRFEILDSPLFPPGYPVLLTIESWIQGSPYFIKMFEQIILMTAIPVLVLMVLQKFARAIDPIFVFVIFTAPFMFIGMSTINISSEIWYTLIVLAGLLNLLGLEESNLFRKLFYSSFLFSFAYLMRPEALVYFVSWIFALRHWLSSYHKTLRSLEKKLLFLLIPPASAVLSLVFFLTNFYGQVTLTGKLKINYEFSRGISENTLIRALENSLGLLRVLVSPMFYGPALVLLAMTGIFMIFLRKMRVDSRALIVFTPSLLVLFALLILYPMGRPLIPSIVSIVILAHFGWEKIKVILPGSKGSPQRFILAIVLIAQTFFPYFGNQLFDSTKGYYEAIEGIQSNSKLLIYSRETTLVLFKNDFQYCSLAESCQDTPDYLLLSDSSRAKLGKMNEIETSGKFPGRINAYGVEYRRVAFSTGPYHKVYTYKLVN